MAPTEWRCGDRAILTHLLFICFVAVAVYVQNLTGFALALILLGLVGVVDLVPLPDASNAVCALSVVNAVMYFSRTRLGKIERGVFPAMGASLLGYAMGMALLVYLAAGSYELLRSILGFSVVTCALLLWRAGKPLEQTSPTGHFAAVGTLSGILGGLFSTAGPPLVYLAYRQPWPIDRIQASLVFCFGVGGGFRLVVMAATGHFSAMAIQLAVVAIPVTMVVTAWAANRPPPISRQAIQHIVCVLLVISGGWTLVSSLLAMLSN